MTSSGISISKELDAAFNAARKDNNVRFLECDVVGSYLGIFFFSSFFFSKLSPLHRRGFDGDVPRKAGRKRRGAVGSDARSHVAKDAKDFSVQA